MFVGSLVLGAMLSVAQAEEKCSNTEAVFEDRMWLVLVRPDDGSVSSKAPEYILLSTECISLGDIDCCPDEDNGRGWRTAVIGGAFGTDYDYPVVDLEKHLGKDLLLYDPAGILVDPAVFGDHIMDGFEADMNAWRKVMDMAIQSGTHGGFWDWLLGYLPGGGAAGGIISGATALAEGTTNASKYRSRLETSLEDQTGENYDEVDPWDDDEDKEKDKDNDNDNDNDLCVDCGWMSLAHEDSIPEDLYGIDLVLDLFTYLNTDLLLIEFW